jgi:hypothetical protein
MQHVVETFDFSSFSRFSSHERGRAGTPRAGFSSRKEVKKKAPAHAAAGTNSNFGTITLVTSVPCQYHEISSLR